MASNTHTYLIWVLWILLHANLLVKSLAIRFGKYLQVVVQNSATND